MRAANILLTNGASGKCSIAFNCPGNVTTLIADFKSIIAPQSTAAKAPIAVTGTVTNRYADRYEALGGVAPTSVPTYVGQELIDSSGSKVYKAKGYTSSADWVALN